MCMYACMLPHVCACMPMCERAGQRVRENILTSWENILTSWQRQIEILSLSFFLDSFLFFLPSRGWIIQIGISRSLTIHHTPAFSKAKWSAFNWFKFVGAISAAAAAKSLQSCLTLCDPRDGSPPGFPVPGILQARTLEWVAISFSNAVKWKAKVKLLSRVRLFTTPWTAAYQAPPSMGFSRQEHWSGCLQLLRWFDTSMSLTLL